MITNKHLLLLDIQLEERKKKNCHNREKDRTWNKQINIERGTSDIKVICKS